MKKALVLVLAVVISLPSFAYSEESNDQEAYDPQYTMLALNMAIVSVHRILSANDRLILNQEYQNIINNLSIGNIKSDPEITELYNKMINVIGKKRLREDELKQVIAHYDSRMQSRFAEAMSNFDGGVRYEVAGERNEVSGGGIASGLVNAVMNLLSSCTASYFRYQASEGEIRRELDANLYTVQAEDMKAFDDMQQQLLSSSWNLMYKYRLPDEYRLVQKTMDDFYRAVEEPDEAPRRLRMLRALEEDFKVYPPYWYYRARTAQEADNKPEADKCFDKFDEIWRPVLKKDPYRLEVTKYRLTELIKDGIPQSGDVQQEALNLLGVMRKNTQLDDWTNNLFAGILYYALDDKDSAEKCIETNIDFRHEQEISSAMLTNIRAGVEPSLLLSDTLRTMNLTKLLIPVNSKDKEAAYMVAEYFDGRKFMEDARKRNADNPLILHTDMITMLRKADSASFKGMYETAKKQTDAKNEIYASYSGILDMVKSYADKDNISAQIFLADMFNYGWGVKRDANSAMTYYVKAGNQGDVYSKLMYINLMLYKEDYQQAKPAKKAEPAKIEVVSSINADKIFAEGMKFYAARNYQGALNRFSQAAISSHSGAQFMLGVMYENGYGVEKNLEDALNYYRSAAEKGHSSAQKAYERLLREKPEKSSWWPF